MSAPEAPRPAATVVLLRQEAGCRGPRVFFVRRHGRSGFMPGAHVFPGGRLDPQDGSAEVRARCAGLDEAAAARRLGERDGALGLALHVAAARETFEEAEVLLAEVRAAPEELAARAEAVRRGAIPFAEALAQLGATLRPDWLVPLSRWVTPPEEPRRYDARFFVATLPAGQRARHDGLETTEGRWMSAAEALHACERGEIWLAPPTLRTVEWLARFADAEEAMAAAASRRPPLVEPVLRHLPGGERAICLPGDPLHPERSRPVIEGPTRMVLRGGRFRSEEPGAAR